MSLKKSDIKGDYLRPITTTNYNHLTRAFFESWLEVFDICPRSGFLIPCISLMWFFNIMLVANVVLVSVQYLKITATSNCAENWISNLACFCNTINLPAGVDFRLSIMGGAIVSPQSVSRVEGLLTVSTWIFLYQLLKRETRWCF